MNIGIECVVYNQIIIERQRLLNIAKLKNDKF